MTNPYLSNFHSAQMWQKAVKGTFMVAFEYDKLRQQFEYDPTNKKVEQEMLDIIDVHGLKRQPYPKGYFKEDSGLRQHYGEVAEKLRKDAHYFEREGRLG